MNEHQFARGLFGWSAKTLRNLAALDEPLRMFPELVRAVTGTDGRPPIGRCAALRVGKVATAETIETWIERARACSIREFDALIRNADTRATPGTGTSVPPESSNDAPDHPVADTHDEKVLFRIQLPPEARMALDEVADLHRAFAGQNGSLADFLVDLLAEVSACGLWAPDPECSSHGRFPQAHREDSKPNGVSAQRQNVFTQGSDEWPTSTTEGRFATRLLKGFAHDLRDLARIMRHLETIQRAPHSQSWQMREITRIMRSLVRYENQIEVRMGSLLLEQHEQRAWRTFGFGNLGEYAEQRLEWSRSSARRRVEIARALRRLPIVRDAYASGRIGLEQAEWIVRATRKVALTKEEERNWVDHVEPATLRRLREENRVLERDRLQHRAAVARAVTMRYGRNAKRRLPASGKRPADSSGPPADTSEPATGTGEFATDTGGRSTDTGGHSNDRSGRRTDEEAAPADAIRTPAKAGSAEATFRRFLDPPDDATWLRSVTRVPGQTRNRLLDFEGALLERVLMRGAMLDVKAVFSLPEWLARDLLSCLTTLRSRVCKEALEFQSAAEEARTLLSVRIAAAYLEQSSRVPLWVALLAALELCALEWDDPRRKTASQPLQRKVIERDGCRCTVPGCTARRNLQVNHIQERSHGGPDEEWNLHAVCAAHHLHYIHSGLARVRGRAPGDMEWRLGRSGLAQWFVNDRRIRTMI
ncbi:MAG: DUF222 domain-containing protein [Candidatus Latescibacterota bacterium]|nr:MAG: DUF222 domain-containing protein [Candidatus Latescibacterota bacterium]